MKTEIYKEGFVDERNKILDWIKKEVRIQPTDRGIKHLKSQIISYIIPLAKEKANKLSKEYKINTLKGINNHSPKSNEAVVKTININSEDKKPEELGDNGIRSDNAEPSGSDNHKFNCDECCNDFNYEPNNINGEGQYCKTCVSKLIGADEFKDGSDDFYSPDFQSCLKDASDDTLKGTSVCDDCGRTKGQHDKKGYCYSADTSYGELYRNPWGKKFKPKTDDVCECGHDIYCHVNGKRCAGCYVDGRRKKICKKFKPKK